MYSKIIENGFVIAVGENIQGKQITDDEYAATMSVILTRPAPPFGFDYALRASDLEWELIELPSESIDPEIDNDELINILLGDTE